jgi:hypothetical protein
VRARLIIDAADVDNLRRIADALLPHRLETFILFAKLSPFSSDEIALVKTLNGPYRRRVILLTARELEPYHIYDRTQKEVGITSYGVSPDELAAVTAQLFISKLHQTSKHLEWHHHRVEVQALSFSPSGSATSRHADKLARTAAPQRQPSGLESVSVSTCSGSAVSYD